jgi:hypothetical protein
LDTGYILGRRADSALLDGGPACSTTLVGCLFIKLRSDNLLEVLKKY